MPGRVEAQAIIDSLTSLLEEWKAYARQEGQSRDQPQRHDHQAPTGRASQIGQTHAPHHRSHERSHRAPRQPSLNFAAQAQARGPVGVTPGREIPTRPKGARHGPEYPLGTLATEQDRVRHAHLLPW